MRFELRFGVTVRFMDLMNISMRPACSGSAATSADRSPRATRGAVHTARPLGAVLDRWKWPSIAEWRRPIGYYGLAGQRQSRQLERQQPRYPVQLRSHSIRDEYCSGLGEQRPTLRWS